MFWASMIEVTTTDRYLMRHPEQEVNGASDSLSQAPTTNLIDLLKRARKPTQKLRDTREVERLFTSQNSQQSQSKGPRRKRKRSPSRSQLSQRFSNERLYPLYAFEMRSLSPTYDEAGSRLRPVFSLKQAYLVYIPLPKKGPIHPIGSFWILFISGANSE